MNPGVLRNRVTLQTPSNASNPDASQAQGWTAYASHVPAAIWSLTGKQLVEARQAFSDVSCKVRIRFQTGIRPNDQVLAGSRVLGIRNILDPDNRGIYLDLLCEELSNGT